MDLVRNQKGWGAWQHAYVQTWQALCDGSYVAWQAAGVQCQKLCQNQRYQNILKTLKTQMKSQMRNLRDWEAWQHAYVQTWQVPLDGTCAA